MLDANSTIELNNFTTCLFLLTIQNAMWRNKSFLGNVGFDLSTSRIVEGMNDEWLVEDGKNKLECDYYRYTTPEL